MIYSDWSKIYFNIIKDLNINFEDDKKSTFMLNNILENNPNYYYLEKLIELIKNNEIIIFGAGPSIENSIKKNSKLIKNKVLIAADGATSALLNFHILPHVIVTDLDGKISDQLKANQLGSIIVVHAHGDNINIIKKNLKKFNGIILGTTQIDPSNFNNVFNFGGFTDGDRAVYISDHFNAAKIFLLGFDFDGRIGKYSFSKKNNKNQKIKKLKWCKELIYKLMKLNKNIVFI
jgi:uncharacterized Rossmann fold enzyme